MSIAVFIGVIGYSVSVAGGIPMLTTSSESETVVIQLANLMSQHGFIFILFAAIILSGILAATMSTADSQLLAAASSVSQDLAQDFLGIKLSNRQQMRASGSTCVESQQLGIPCRIFRLGRIRRRIRTADAPCTLLEKIQ